jgi:hypothetical protein
MTTQKKLLATVEYHSDMSTYATDLNLFTTEQENPYYIT